MRTECSRNYIFLALVLRRIYEKSQDYEEYRGMGTTLTLAFVDEASKLHVFLALVLLRISCDQTFAIHFLHIRMIFCDLADCIRNQIQSAVAYLKRQMF